MSIETMVEGAKRTVSLADRIDQACSHEKKKRISMIDIGGGLSANYMTDKVSPSFEEYAMSLQQQCPKLFQAGRVVVTEFGKALIAKAAGVVALIEDILINPTSGNVTAIIHAGADLFLRTAYCPEKFHHRVHLLSNTGLLLSDPKYSTLTNSHTSASIGNVTRDNLVNTTVAGPLCFSGDVLASNIFLPVCKIGDYVLIMDSGANTISLFSRHCSRQAPAVFAYRNTTYVDKAKVELQVVSKALGDEEEDKQKVLNKPMNLFHIACIKPKETETQVLEFWG
jgi:diaminopimelate decarboxylase